MTTVSSSSKSLEYAIHSCCDSILSKSNCNLFTFFVTPDYPKKELMSINELLMKKLNSTALIGQVCNSIGSNSSGISLTAWNISKYNSFKLNDLGNAKQKSVGKWHEFNQKVNDNFLTNFESVSLPSLPSDVSLDIQNLYAQSKTHENPFLFVLTGKEPQSTLELIDRTMLGVPMVYSYQDMYDYLITIRLDWQVLILHFTQV